MRSRARERKETKHRGIKRDGEGLGAQSGRWVIEGVRARKREDEEGKERCARRVVGARVTESEERGDSKRVNERERASKREREGEKKARGRRAY